MTIERSLVRKLAKEISITWFTQYMHLLKKNIYFYKENYLHILFWNCFSKIYKWLSGETSVGNFNMFLCFILNYYYLFLWDESLVSGNN